MDTNKPLENKVAIVTGGSRGIGAAIAKRLAKEGCHVVITYQKERQKAEEVVREIQSDGKAKAFALHADSSDIDATKNVIHDTIEAFGHLDILVNNAGVAKILPLDQLSMDDFEHMVQVNIRAPFVAVKEAAKYMTPGGRIIMIGSVNADKVPFQGGSLYAMTKAAIAGMTKGLAKDLGPKGITVNNIQPGPIETDMNPSQGDFAEQAMGIMAIKNYGEADDVAGLVAFLVSPEASYMTGGSHTIDGGYTS